LKKSTKNRQKYYFRWLKWPSRTVTKNYVENIFLQPM